MPFARLFASAGLAFIVACRYAPGRTVRGEAHQLDQATRYLPTLDTLRFKWHVSFWMYYVRGRDTLGRPDTFRGRESRYFRRTPGGLEARIRLEPESGDSVLEDNILTIDPSGRVLLINGRLPSESGDLSVDRLPRLPSPVVPLARGVEWTDTVSVAAQETWGPTYYEVRRRHHVLRLVDSLGSRLAVIAGEGEMRVRRGAWLDSSKAWVWWQEVAGPVKDTTYFDVREGQVVGYLDVGELRGTGAVGPIGSGSVPSALLFTNRLTRVQ